MSTVKAKKKCKKRKSPEGELQKRIVKYCRDHPNPKLWSLFSSVNGFGLTTVGLKVKAQTLGMLVGLPDLCLPIDGGCCWIELKHGKNKLSEKQRGVHAMLDKLQGHTVHTCWTFEEVTEILDSVI